MSRVPSLGMRLAGPFGRGRDAVIPMAHARRVRQLRREVYDKFRAGSAVAPERARSLEALGLAGSPVLDSLLRARVIREVNAGKFYLDEDARREYGWMLMRWAAVPISILLALMIYAIARV